MMDWVKGKKIGREGELHWKKEEEILNKLSL